jgi:hypothetical protein
MLFEADSPRRLGEIQSLMGGCLEQIIAEVAGLESTHVAL